MYHSLLFVQRVLPLSLTLSPSLSNSFSTLPRFLSLERDAHVFRHSCSPSSFSILSVYSLSSSWHPDGRQWFMLVIVGKTCCCSTGVKYACCTMCARPCQLWLALSFSDSPLASLCSANLFFLLSNFPFFLVVPSPHTLFFLFSSRGSYLFSAPGQNNSSQLTPISSRTPPLLPFFLFFFFHLSIMMGPTGWKRYFKWIVFTCKTFTSNTFQWF